MPFYATTAGLKEDDDLCLAYLKVSRDPFPSLPSPPFPFLLPCSAYEPLERLIPNLTLCTLLPP